MRSKADMSQLNLQHVYVFFRFQKRDYLRFSETCQKVISRKQISSGNIEQCQILTAVKMNNKYQTAIYQVKGKVFPYSLTSVGPGADPGVQAVSPQVT